MNSNQHNLTGLLFIEPAKIDEPINYTETQDEDSGFLGNLFSSVRGMFTSNGKSVSKFAQELGDEMTLIEIDATNPDFNKMMGFFNVTSLPRLVAIHDGRVLVDETPTKKSVKSIKKASELCFQTTVDETIKDHSKNSVVTIAPGQAQFKPINKEDPYYFGDNEATYEEKYYRNSMNGGLITKSDRIPINKNGSKTYSVEKVEQSQSETSRGSGSLSLVNDISYYGDSIGDRGEGVPPPPVKIEFERIPEPEKAIFVQPVIPIAPVVPIEPAEPTNIVDVIINRVTPVRVKQKVPKEQSKITMGKVNLVQVVEHKIDIEVMEEHKVELPQLEEHKVEIPQKEEHKVELPQLEEHKVELPQLEEHKVEIAQMEEHNITIPIVTQVDIAQIAPIVEVEPIEVEEEVTIQKFPTYKQRKETSIRTVSPPIRERVIYEEVYETEPEMIEEDTKIITTYRTVPRDARRREVITRVPYQSTIGLDEKWRQVLSEEEIVIGEINELFKEDSTLAERLKLSEQEIKESELKFKKARDDIENTLLQSEEKMREYEVKLQELYVARDLALRTREHLYQPCQK